MTFTRVSDHAARVAFNSATRVVREQSEQLTAANTIIAEQNAVLARAHGALLWAFENLTPNSNVIDLKRITAVLAEIEGRKLQ